MKKWIHASSSLTNSVDFIRKFVPELKQQVDSKVVTNLRYNEIRVEDIENERTLTSDVVDALHNLGYCTFIPEFEDYVAVIEGDKFIKLYISSYLEANNQFNGYIDIDYREQSVLLEDWADSYSN